MKHLPKPAHFGLRDLAVIGAAMGAVAVGAFAIGALTIRWLGIGQLAVGKARVASLEIDDLAVSRLRAGDVSVSGSLRLPTGEVAGPRRIP